VTSAKKIAANRNNARKSTGPKTAKGKARASRNAIRHGLATIGRDSPSVSAQIERIAQAICGGDAASPAQYEQALIIAECEVVLLRVRLARVAAIERARRNAPSSKGLIPGFPTNQEWAHAFYHLAHGRPQDMAILLDQGADAVRLFSTQMSASHPEVNAQQGERNHQQSTVRDDGEGAMPPSRNPSLTMDSSELDVLRRAVPDLMSLDRYARRAFSRRRRAIRNFIASSIVHRPSLRAR